MWSNGDVSGKKTAAIAIFFTVLLTALAPVGYLLGYANTVWAIGGTLIGLVMLRLCMKFKGQGDRPSARKLFLYTLLYLPLGLVLLAIGWKSGL